MERSDGSSREWSTVVTPRTIGQMDFVGPPMCAIKYFLDSL